MDPSAHKLFQDLERHLAKGDAEKIDDVIYELGAAGSGQQQIPDSTVEALLSLLRRPEMFHSKFAGRILNFFEFESTHLSDHQKQLCLGFLSAHGDQFDDVHSRQVVTELRFDHYLK